MGDGLLVSELFPANEADHWLLHQTHIEPDCALCAELAEKDNSRSGGDAK